MTKSILYSLQNKVATLTFNEPSQLNSFGRALVEGLHQRLDQATQDNARVIVFRAEGKGFSGGLDLSGLEDESDGDLLLRLVRIEQLLQRIRHLSSSTLALVHGACYGAAADLVLACRVRVATSDARFLMPGLRFGIVLGTQRLRDTVGEPAAYRLLDRSNPFTAAEAMQSHFLTNIAEQEDWQPIIDQHMLDLSQVSAEAYANRVSQLTPDTRSSDMAALVNSMAHGSIKLRISEYAAMIKKSKTNKK